MSVLLFGPKNDAQLHSVGAALRARGTSGFPVDSRGPVALVLDLARPAHSTLDGVRAMDFSGAYVSALPPVNLAFLNESASVTLEAFAVGQMEADARRDAMVTFLGILSDLGRPVLNPPRGGTMVTNKPQQLLAAKAQGITIPATCVTSEPDAVGAFLGRGVYGVAKPVRGGAHAVLLNASDDKLNRLSRAPIIVQERVHGPDVRVLLLDGAVLSSARIEGFGDGAVDFRQNRAYQAGRAQYASAPLDDEDASRLVALASAVGMPFCGVDLKHTETGYVFLEMNAAPAWVEQAGATGDDVAGALAAHLSRPS